MELPQYNEHKKLADKGVSIVKYIIESELNWIFRKVPLDDDFGLDGYIDILQDGKFVTGKSIGVQIKTGTSYFEKLSNSGWHYYGENKHLNYYLNNRIPIIIVIVNPETQKAYWNEINLETIIKTEKSWKININKSQILNNKKSLLEISGDFVDYAPQIEYISKVNKAMNDSGLIFIAIGREEIEESNFEGIQLLLKWLIKTDDTIEKCRGKVMVSVFGYDDDPRELFQINEVRKWMKDALGIFKYWGYFIAMEEKIRFFSTLRTLMFCNIESNFLGYNEIEKKVRIEYDLNEAKEFKNKIFEWLNEFSEIYSIKEKYVFEQTMLIFQTIDGVTNDEVMKKRKEFGFE